MMKTPLTVLLTGILALSAGISLTLGCAKAVESAGEVAVPGQQTPKPKPAGGGFVWWEAENPTKTNFPPATQNPFAPNDTEKDVLSGGAWIGAPDNRAETLFLEYEVTLPAAGNYEFYVRKFWQHGPFRWRIDNGEWTNVGNASLLDDAPIRQFVGANWIHAGMTKLEPGKHTVRIELTQKTGAACFDAFVLTTQPFSPRGKMKPGEKYNRTEPGWFAFEPEPDSFTTSPIDLRYLNEKFSGEEGQIQAKGEKFVHSKTGKPVRFWAVNAGGDFADLPQGQMEYLARYLAKYGVNMVRIHGSVAEGNNWREPNKEHIAGLHRFVAAMKKEGIYVSISIYFPLWFQPNDLAGYKGDKHPFATLYFNEEFQNVYRGWWKALMTPKNPYTGLSLAEDPTVAIAELVNEDSYFFWTFTPYENIPAEQMAILEKQFGTWLAKKYGSVGQALSGWGGQAIRGDDTSAGRVGFMPLWAIFNERSKRAQDTAAFLTESQESFYHASSAYLKKDLGFKGMVYGSNWITADASRLGPLDKLTNIGPGLDLMDRHGYFGGPHIGERAGYSLNPGEKYDDRSALLFTPEKPGEAPNYSLPIWDLRYNGMPSIITEINWPMPNRFRADQPLLAAAYGALQGTDGMYFFALGGPTWMGRHGKFDIQTPVNFGQYPATALLYRQGLIKEGPSVAEVNLKRSELYALNGAPVSAPLNLDELRAKDVPPGKLAPVSKVTSLDPLAFAVGRVTLNFAEGATAPPSQVADLTPYIDQARKVVKSGTGELAWNWGEGRMVVNAPQAQGVTGFLSKAGKVSLADVTIQTGMEYGTILVVALDGKPLKTSSKLLVQVMSEDKNYGWKTSADTGLRDIQSTGDSPILVKNLSGTVSLLRPDANSLKVTALDLNGYPGASAGTGKTITLKPDVLYYLVEK